MKELIKAIEKRNLARQDFELEEGVTRQRIAEMLRRERKRLGLTLREMAKKLGVSAPYLSDIELGRRGVSAEMLEKLRKV